MRQGYGKKAYVGLSGGVDSAVSAALLKKAGYQVTGVFIKVWSPPFMECTWKEDRLDAMRVAAALNIDFVTLDLEADYKKEVVDSMVAEYQHGRVPNPDVMCNRFVKFGAFYKFARLRGADVVATGHYAQILSRKDGGFSLAVSTDTDKDQTYFLWTIPVGELPHIMFPIGSRKKSDVRLLAKRLKLPNAEKKDSQGLCFLGAVDIKNFLGHFIQLVPGTVLNEQGETIGTHPGAVLFALGQRHGFSIAARTAESKSYKVIDKDIQKNTITVSSAIALDTNKFVSHIFLTDVNVFSSIKDGDTCLCRFRYRQKLLPCEIESIDLPRCVVRLKTPEPFISTGQSLVGYKNGTVVFGGVIDSTK